MAERTTAAVGERAITIRLLVPADAEGLDGLHGRLSPETIYRRYFSPRKPSRQELAHICQLNGAGGGALVAVHAGTIVGVAYYVTVDGHTAEPAILIEDRFQRQGIGRRLATSLMELAQARGIEVFKALILPENRAVLQLIRGSGLPYETHYSQGARAVRLSLMRAVPLSA